MKFLGAVLVTVHAGHAAAAAAAAGAAAAGAAACGAACPTITRTVRATDCTPVLTVTTTSSGQVATSTSVCFELECIHFNNVTIPCSCANLLPDPVRTTTVTDKCTCRSGCEVQETAVFAPCG